VTLDLPFIEPRRYDEAAAFLEGIPKRGFLCNRLSLRIDTLIPDLGVFRPRWDQAPTKLDESACRGVGFNPYRGDVLRRSDIVAGLKEWRRFLDLELFSNDLGRGYLRKSSAHD
jgi:hypothetical protein